MARNKKQKERPVVDFATLVELPERLTQYLRLWFHTSKADWDFMVDKIRQGNPYREWSKSKGRGKGRRYFAAPCDELKLVQKSILNQLLSQIPVHFCRHGGVQGSSIITNAMHHVSFAKSVFAVDIVNAFPNVLRSRVRACLRKPVLFGLRQFGEIKLDKKDTDMILEAIVDLLVWKDRLPQGPPTSPRIFEIVCGKTDQQLFNFVNQGSSAIQEFRLSIYADNVTVSSNEFIYEDFREALVKIIQKNGFITHTRKDKMQYFSPEVGTVPVVTGLVITGDDRLLMHPDKVNQFRGRLNKLLKQVVWDKDQHGEVAGILGYIRQIYPKGKAVPSKIHKVVAVAEDRLAKLSNKKTKAVKPVKKSPVTKNTTKPVVPKGNKKNSHPSDLPFVPDGKLKEAV